MPTQNGTPGNDTLTGDSSNDTLNGLGGDDILNGLNGHDILNGGDDNDQLDGGDGNDTLSGDAGNDQLYGGENFGIDDLDGGDGDDILDAGVHGYAAGFSDPQEHLYGGAGNDVLRGAGGQAMYGGTGDDLYYVDTERGSIGDFDHIIPEDRVFELDGEGTDTIRSTLGGFTITDSQSIEILILEDQTSSSIRQLGGNSFANTLIGNAAANALGGNGGNDIIFGNGGNDDLDGGDGDDVIVGGTGADRMLGGAGSDIYYVDDSGDTLVEPVAVGNDRVATTVSYALGADADIELFEAITQSASNAMELIGNGFSQVIVGNDGNNRIVGGGGSGDVLYGLGGADTLLAGGGDDYLVGGDGVDMMNGGAGSDTYYVDIELDTVNDAVAPGTDRVAASVNYTLGENADIEVLEAITLSATDAFTLVGNGFDQTIIGNNGANNLNGGGGVDVLVGAGGADNFFFGPVLGSFLAQIADFSAADDTMMLDDDIFTGLTPGALPAAAFVIGSQAGDADDRIIYNSATGALYFDADGSGAGAMVQFATLSGAPAITASDFTVI